MRYGPLFEHFTVAHTITLGSVKFRVAALPAVLIETVIPASVVLAALDKLLVGSIAIALIGTWWIAEGLGWLG